MRQRNNELGIATVGLLVAAFAISAIEKPVAVAEPEPDALITIESPLTPLVDGGSLPGPEKPDLPPPTDSGGSAGRATPAGTAPESPAPAIEPVDLSQFVYRIQVGNSHGSCVSIGGKKFVTCWHVVDAGGRQAVKIDGQWVRGQWQYDAARDVAVMTCDLERPGVDLSTDWSGHLAAATVVGLPGIEPAKQTSLGFIADFDLVALETDQPVIAQGESGGGVFVEGKLVGVLRGFSSGADVPKNPLAARFTAFALVPSLFAPQAPAAAATPAPQQSAKQWRQVLRCRNGQCRWEWEQQ